MALAMLRQLAALVLVAQAWADQHVLLDTTKESMLDWTRYPYGPQSPTPGWVEESFTNFEKGINWRSYVVCDVGYQNVNNWLWTPFITRHDANRIFIEIKFSLRNCDLFPGTALQCKETFSLLYYEFDAATREPPPWEPESYKQIDVIAADEGRFTNNNEVIINTETRSVEVTKKGVYFAFRDQGACLSLLAVKVYYLKCPEITLGFAHYPETASGSQLTSIEKVYGTCIDHAVAPKTEKPYNLCKADGTWSFHNGLCLCAAGFEAEETTQVCKSCPVGKYKHSQDNGQCEICPAYSQALFQGSVECQCNDGFFRSAKDPKSSACTRPAGPPINLGYQLVDGSSVRLTWDPPADEGGRADTYYRLQCSQCSTHVTFRPSNSNHLTDTSVAITGLEQSKTYIFTVTALNGVSNLSLSGNATSSEIRVTLSHTATSEISNIQLKQIGSTQVTLSWQPPTDSLLDIDVYEVKYYVRGSNHTSTVITKRDHVEVGSLVEGTEYGFQVRAQTAKGWGEFSQPLYGVTGKVVDPVFVGEEDNLQVRVAVGVGIAIALILAVIGFMYFYVRRNNPNFHKHPEKNRNVLDYRGMDNFTGTMGISDMHIGGPVYNPFSTHKTYVDPHTYEDPNVAVKQFAKEIDSKVITIEAIIGGGEFGDVCRGKLTFPDRNEMHVAIKTLKQCSSEKAKMDFLTEASIMGQFEHPNVIFLQGVVTKANPIMIITEYMENGSLDTFLRANDAKFQVTQLIAMMRGIAFGMNYLSEMNYVHRDLAARNVLVNSQLVCKIADFGLSREILDSNVDGAYTTRGGKIPVRWTAPEAIAFRKFTSASDVWSFGIVMWEVMSYGERPYWTWSNQDVIKAIEKNYRLPAPMDCPEAIHQLMLDTWQKERSHRPSFACIVKTLDKLICCPETLKKIALSPIHNHYTTDLKESFHSVEEWLTAIKMTRYIECFHKAGILKISSVANLTLPQLVDMGITLVGHQKKIMNSIELLKLQLSANMSAEGFLV